MQKRHAKKKTSQLVLADSIQSSALTTCEYITFCSDLMQYTWQIYLHIWRISNGKPSIQIDRERAINLHNVVPGCCNWANSAWVCFKFLSKRPTNKRQLFVKNNPSFTRTWNPTQRVRSTDSPPPLIDIQYIILTVLVEHSYADDETNYCYPARDKCEYEASFQAGTPDPASVSWRAIAQHEHVTKKR